ncbi:MAG: hypothetical protein KatS3mg130_0387 [Candidatus Sumerlaea sp.]|nr:MAG: hypothetical protein KatS3mg130_0387 [Candidatus Sumerlaea sp.]
MRRAARNNLELSGVLKGFEALNDVALILIHKHPATFGELAQVHLRQWVKLGLETCPDTLFLGQFDETFDVADVTRLKEVVREHGHQRRRETHGEAKIYAIPHKAVHHIEQRNIRFGDCLVEPVFLKEILVLGMANKRQMRVQH